MTDIAALQSDILAQVAGAGDEAALEAVRVAALGKKGSISELMKTLAMSPEERKTQGPALNGLRDAVTQAIAARKAALGDAALDARLASKRSTSPCRPAPKPKAASIPSRRCWKKSPPSSPIWALPWPKARMWNSTITPPPS